MGIDYYHKTRYYDWRRVAKWRKDCAKVAILSLEAERKAELATLRKALSQVKRQAQDRSTDPQAEVSLAGASKV